MKNILTIAFIIFLGFILYFAIESNQEKKDKIDNQLNQQPTVETKEFVSPDYGFVLEYPSDWNEFSEHGQLSPKFNFYPSDSLTDEELPLDHFSNETHASVFPLGIPTENVKAQSISVRESDIEFPYDLTNDSRVFVLENGEPFAAYLKLQDSPDSWNSSGFVWVRVAVDNLETRCERNGEVISQQECDPLVRGDEVIWSGEVNSDDWDTAVSIAESFSFRDSSETPSDDTSDNVSNEQIIIENPESNQIISSPINLEGQVRGTWLFEATAPVVLVDWDGRIIAESFIQAEGNWMTENFVPFSGEIEFEEPEDLGDFSDRGTLIFRKANPSGLPENDDAIEVNVRFR